MTDLARPPIAASAAGEGLYLPAGTYTISAPLNVDDVKVLGAGECTPS